MSAAVQAIELVRRLNDPQWASGAKQISDELQQLQLLPQGWEVADAMLAHEDANVKFYGALTLQIKLNKNRAMLDEQAAIELIHRLISWFVRFTCGNERRLVLDKLCSTLATYFIQSPVPWTQALRQIICSLHAEVAVSTESLSGYPDTSQIIGQLSSQKLHMAIRFCRVLAEDVLSGASLGPQYYHLDGLLKSNTTDSAMLMSYSLNTSFRVNPEVRVDAISCFLAWVTYGHPHWNTDPVTLQLLQNITSMAAEYLLNGDEEIRDPTIDLFVGILEYRSRFLQKEQLEMISLLVRRTIGPQCLSQIQSDPKEHFVATFGKLITAYGKLIIKDLVSHRDQGSSQEMIALFQQLLCGPGYPAEQDEIILSATEFWIEYAEHIVDTFNDSSDEEFTFLNIVRNDLIQAVQNYIPKLRPPPRDEIDDWDEDNIDRWEFFRDNINDFLEAVNSIPDTHLLGNMVMLAMNVLPSKQWLDLEATMFAINCISDSIALGDPENVQALSTLMGSSLFSDISDNNVDVPMRAKRAAMVLIDRYSSFIKKNSIFLPPVLTFLFTTLATTPADKVKLADASAKSFESLCSSCRKALTQHLGELLQQCPQALSGPSANTYQKEKVMAALASIIQALPTEQTKADPLIALIEVVEIDLNGSVIAIQEGRVEDGETLGTTALQCLASIGKGIQAPADDIVDLSDEETESTPSAENFWIADTGAAIQQRILNCFSIVDYLHSQGDAIDAACAVLRAGLTETEPGPFVFPPAAIVNFIQKAQLATPRVETILGTACSFVSKYSRKNIPHLFDEVLIVYQRVALVMRELGEPRNDPQLAQICIDFLQRLLGKYIDVLLAPSDEDIASILNFVIQCLTGEAPMLKRNAAGFFETLLGLANPRSPLPLPPSRIHPTTVISFFSTPLANALIFNIGGIAQRSELDSICKPLRAFIFSQPVAKQCLENALMSPEFPSGNVGEKEKRMFLLKIMGLRGGRQTNAVVREFWAECKGTVSSFE